MLVHPDKAVPEERARWTEASQRVDVMFDRIAADGIDAWDHPPQSPPDPPSSPDSPESGPASSPVSPRTKELRRAANNARVKLEAGGLNDEQYFWLPRGYGRAGLRYDFPRSIDVRREILQRLFDPPKHPANEDAIWAALLQMLDDAYARLSAKYGADGGAHGGARGPGGQGQQGRPARDVVEVVRALLRDDGDTVLHWLSTTHTPTIWEYHLMKFILITYLVMDVIIHSTYK